VSGAEELTGLDLGEHAEAAYEWPFETIQLGETEPALAPGATPSETG
jgi:hypothetical protein